MTRRCKATTKAGNPCPNHPMPGLDKCFAHAPELAEKRHTGRVTGGYNKRTERRTYKRLPADLKGALEALYRVLEGVESGEVEPAKATAMATVCRAIVVVFEAGIIDGKVRELEARINTQSEKLE